MPRSMPTVRRVRPIHGSSNCLLLFRENSAGKLGL